MLLYPFLDLPCLLDDVNFLMAGEEKLEGGAAGLVGLEAVGGRRGCIGSCMKRVS